jgi:O-antigen/teichoic acid export membrane protein
MAVDVLFAFSLPVVVWMMIMAPDIIMVISGPEFTGSVLPMIIISPLVFIVGYEQILVLQTLLPLGKDKVLLRNSIMGALVGVALNLALVPVLASIGSAIVWIVSECLILILSQIAVSKELRIGFPALDTLKNILIYLPLIGLVAACCLIPSGALVRVTVSMLVVATYVLVYQVVIRKNELMGMIK